MHVGEYCYHYWLMSMFLRHHLIQTFHHFGFRSMKKLYQGWIEQQPPQRFPMFLLASLFLPSNSSMFHHHRCSSKECFLPHHFPYCEGCAKHATCLHKTHPDYRVPSPGPMHRFDC